jgi:hypothetical protein
VQTITNQLLTLGIASLNGSLETRKTQVNYQGFFRQQTLRKSHNAHPTTLSIDIVNACQTIISQDQ